MFIAINCWSCSGLSFLVHHQYWTLTETPLRYPTVALSRGDPVAMVSQDQSLKKHQQVIGGIDTEVGQLKALVLHVDLGGS